MNLEQQTQSDNSQLENSPSMNELMIEIEEHDSQTANAIYYQTWLCATKEEKAQPNTDFGKEAFRGINGVKVGMTTKLKALQTVLNDRKKEYDILQLYLDRFDLRVFRQDFALGSVVEIDANFKKVSKIEQKTLAQ